MAAGLTGGTPEMLQEHQRCPGTLKAKSQMQRSPPSPDPRAASSTEQVES